MLRQIRLVVVDLLAVNVFHLRLVSIRIHVHLLFLNVHFHVRADVHLHVRLYIHVDMNSRRFLQLRGPINLFLRYIACRLRRKQQQSHSRRQHREKICPAHTQLLNSAC